MSNSWFDTGYDGAEQERERREDEMNQPRRFFLKVGAKTEVIFLDDFSKQNSVTLPDGRTVQRPAVPFCFDEHQITINGDWKNWRTCIAKVEPPCPICADGHRKYYVGMLTVLSSWTANDGTVKWYKNLFPAKLDNIERIRRQLSRPGRENLQFCKYEIMRTGDRSLTTGDDFEFIQKMDRAAVEALLPQGGTLDPFDYISMFKPDSNATLTKLMQSGAVAPPRGATNNQRPNAFTNAPAQQQQQGTAKGVNTSDNTPAEDDDIPF